MPVYDARSNILNQLVGSLAPEDASVFDSTTKRVVRPIARLLGLDSPEGQIMQAAGPAAPLVSIFPNEEARVAGTKLFQETAKKFGGNIQAAADWFAEHYPRVAAHMSLDRAEHASPTALAFVRTVADKPTQPLLTGITTAGEQRLQANPLTAKSAIAHEGVHAAQNLGNNRFNRLYSLLQSEFGTGPENPLEHTAYARQDSVMLGEPIGQTRYRMEGPLSSDAASTQGALEHLKDSIYNTADQRGLLEDILTKQKATIPTVPVTANRLIRQAGQSSPSYAVQIANEILNSRGVPK